MSDYNVEISRRWARSVESDTIPELFELGESASDEMYEMWFSDDFMEAAQPYDDNEYTLDDEVWADFSCKVRERPYYQQASLEQKRQILAALHGEQAWVYSRELVQDGLWDDVVPTRAGRIDMLSRFVLSGAAGDALAESDPQLLKSAEHFVDGALQQRILIGGAAVYAYHTLYHRPDLAKGRYTTVDESGLFEWTTLIGASMHGDFRTERRARPVHNVTTTLDSEANHYFMPGLYESSAAAYHSTEPGIISGLLYHLVVNAGRQPDELRQSLVARLEKETVNAAGAFGDYGDNDGDIDARALAMRLRDPHGKDTLLYSSIVDAGRADRFQLTRANEGVAFSVVGGNTAKPGMFIPNNEIESYITTMVTANEGRVAPSTALRIIDALQDVAD